MPKYCANCGDEITDPTQNFCEKCGSPIPSSLKAEEGQKSITPTTKGDYRPGGLFDINRNYYILKEKYWDI
ncbi:MAG: zinc-ribbon domain-containing protein [Candidatus Hermodarchaeota archaeon]